MAAGPLLFLLMMVTSNGQNFFMTQIGQFQSQAACRDAALQVRARPDAERRVQVACLSATDLEDLLRKGRVEQ